MVSPKSLDWEAGTVKHVDALMGLTCTCHSTQTPAPGSQLGSVALSRLVWDKCTSFLDIAEGGDSAAAVRKDQHCCSVVPNLSTRPFAFCLDCLSGKRKLETADWGNAHFWPHDLRPTVFSL